MNGQHSQLPFTSLANTPEPEQLGSLAGSLGGDQCLGTKGQEPWSGLGPRETNPGPAFSCQSLKRMYSGA